MMLLLIVCVVAAVAPGKIPLNPVTVPVPWMVIAPILLLETLLELPLKARIPNTGVVLAVVDVALITMVEEPSRLPMVLPVMLPISKAPVADAPALVLA